MDMNEDKKPKLGSGKRFKNLEKKIGKNKKVDNPDAVAASIGRKKYGKKKFQKLAAKGKKKKTHESVEQQIRTVIREELRRLFPTI